jgi:FecR protein
MNNAATSQPSRRQFLQVLSAGVLWTLLPSAAHAVTGATVSKSVFRIQGSAWVNGKRIDSTSVIRPNDIVTTARGSELVFVVGDHAMLLRGSSHLVIEPHQDNPSGGFLIAGLRLLTGKLLSVSRNKGMRIDTPTATIGIRGTGVYLEASPARTYFCICYGEVDVQALHDPDSKAAVVSAHHDQPLYIYAQGQTGRLVRAVPGLARRNHSDAELIMVEALVGRTPPFSAPA